MVMSETSRYFALYLMPVSLKKGKNDMRAFEMIALVVFGFICNQLHIMSKQLSIIIELLK